MRRFLWAPLSFVVFGLTASALSFSGEWDLTLELFPTLRLYTSSLTLAFRPLPGWVWESESTFYSTGLRYQNFYASGFLGDLLVEGKIYFHAEEQRYRRAWLDLKLPLATGTLTLSANHWASSTEYTSDHKKEYGPWPCVNVIPWDEAWCHVGRTLFVYGPVVGYEQPSFLRLYLGHTDFYRFEIYISSSYLAQFESAFGSRFWEAWAAEQKIICVYGEIKDYRYTTEGGYSVPQVSLSSPANLSLHGCCGFPARAQCPPNLIRWFEAKNYAGKTVYVQGPIVSYASEGGVANRLLRIGGGGTVPNRLELYYAPGFPDWFRSRFPVGKFVCVYSTISLVGGVARIVVEDLANFPIFEGTCCGADLLPGQFLNWRLALDFPPLTLTADFGDCSRGTGFRRLKVEWGGLSLCCRLFLDVSLTFTKCLALENLSLTLREFFLPCCGITAKVSATLAPDSLSLTLEPKWPGFSGCLTVYGDVDWTGSGIRGVRVHGWSLSCYAGDVKVRFVTALDPDAVEDRTDVTFYAGEWEYVGVSYARSVSCGEAELEAELWFGSRGILFGLQRVRLYGEFPLAVAIRVFAKAQWNFARASPLEWFDVGWSLEF